MGIHWYIDGVFLAVFLLFNNYFLAKTHSWESFRGCQLGSASRRSQNHTDLTSPMNLWWPWSEWPAVGPPPSLCTLIALRDWLRRQRQGERGNRGSGAEALCTTTADRFQGIVSLDLLLRHSFILTEENLPYSQVVWILFGLHSEQTKFGREIHKPKSNLSNITTLYTIMPEYYFFCEMNNE